MTAKKLTIPLTTTRHPAWRVVWICIAIGILASTVYFAYLLNTYHDQTSYLRPEGTEQTLHISLTPKNRAFLTTHLTDELIFADAPYTMHDVVNTAKNSLSIHLDAANTIIGVSYIPISAQNASQFAFIDSTVTKQATLLCSACTSHTDKQKHAWRFSTLIEHENSRSRVHIGKNALTIQNTTNSFAKNKPIPLPEGATILMQMTHEGLITEHIFAQFAAIQDLYAKNTANTVVYTRNDAIFFASRISTQNPQLDEIAELTKRLAIQNASLSTEALTLNNGSSVREIRYEENALQSSIQGDGDVHIILHTLTDGSGIRASVTNNSILLTNDVNSAEISTDYSIDQCLHSPDVYIQSDVLANTLADSHISISVPEHILSSIFSPAALATNSKKQRLCW